MSQKTAKTVTIKFLNTQNQTVKVVEQQLKLRDGGDYANDRTTILDISELSE